MLVALGGAVGSLLRYSVVLLIRPMSPGFPTGTLVVNVAGCVVIGVLAGIWGPGVASGERHKLLVFTGILGGFTTFSSFSLEFAALLRDGRPGAAAAYVLLSNLLGLTGALLGFAATGKAPVG